MVHNFQRVLSLCPYIQNIQKNIYIYIYLYKYIYSYIFMVHNEEIICKEENGKPTHELTTLQILGALPLTSVRPGIEYAMQFIQ